MLGLDISEPEYFGTDATLSSITVSKGVLEPAFHKDTFIYYLALGVEDDTLEISATPNEATSTVSRGTGVHEITGNTTIYVGCMSEIGQEKFYTIKVTKEVSGIDNVSGHSDHLIVHPNPFHDKITIRTSEDIKFIEIISLQGKVVYHMNVNSNKAGIDLGDLNQGIYFMRTQTSDKNYITRIIKN